MEKEIIVLDDKEPSELFTENGKLWIVEQVQSFISGYVPDITTENGRKEINSISRRIGSVQKRVDDIKKHTTADWKEKAKRIDNSGKSIVDALEIIKADFRKPLTDFELYNKALENRLNAMQGLIQKIYKDFSDLDNAKQILETAYDFDFKSNKEVADNAYNIVTAHLLAVSEMLNRKKEAEIDAIKKQAVEEFEQSERQKLADKEAEKAEAEKRNADIEHKRLINRQVIADFINCGLTEEQALSVLKSIVNNQISNVRIVY